jgi:Secretion system C-terminal sorting domain
MRIRIKRYTLLVCLLLLLKSNFILAQGTLEMVTGNFVGNPPVGPTLGPIGPVSLRKDAINNNQFTNATGSQTTSVTVSITNQVYTGYTYSNISTGLVFGASPTTAVTTNNPAVQQVDPLDTYNLLGTFNLSPGGPTNNMFTSDPMSVPTTQSGTGIICDGFYTPPANDANGAVSVFTAAQVLFDQPGGPALHNSSTRYYFGNVIVDFNRFVSNPVIHIAGLGGNYRYLKAGGNPNVAADWLSTYFTTELQVQNPFPLTRMSGNSFFSVSGNNILNSAAIPNGASANTSGLFNEFGAATGSFRINGTVKTVVLRVYMRGSDASQFPWSATAASIPGSVRNPFTGDIWWVSASAALDQLIPLPVTAVQLNAALNANNVLLNWKTQTEVNLRQFEIERSTDGINFTKIGSRDAKGNTEFETSYSHTDPGMITDVYYYRIRSVDLDGKSTYSNIAIIRKPGDKAGIRLFPNPVSKEINLEFSNAKGSYVINIYSQSGQLVNNRTVTIGNSVQYIKIERGNQPAGLYLADIRNTDTNEKYALKVIFQ